MFSFGKNDNQPKIEYVEGYVCKVTDINENEMKQFDLGETGKVLLIKQDGKLSAIGAKCSHYGAMLSSGALGKGRVRCPWHGACFNIETGDIEDFPTLDSIPCYQVSVEKGQVKVRAKKSELDTNKRAKVMTLRNADDDTTFVVIGAGPSGAICAETLREQGFAGRLVMIGKEPYLPYDRIKISKAMNIDINTTQLRPAAFYENNGIETILNTEVTNLDGDEKEITLSNGYKIKYDKVYIATGSAPRKAPIPGADFPNVCVLRTHEDSHLVNSQLASDKHVVVLGVSFIGLEAAAYCVNKVAKVTVIGRDSVPLKQSFGEAVGARIMEMFQEKGIDFIMNSGIKRCIADAGDDTLTSVELNDGEILKADLCIMGIGSTLYTSFLEDSGVNLNANGSIDTNMFLQSNLEDVYIGGDIANAPVYSSGNELATIGHYGLAQHHGKIAALNMVGKPTELKVVPYFWTVLFGKSFRYTGHGRIHEVHIDGDIKAMKFVAFYMDAEGKVIGIASCQRDPVVSQFAEFLTQGKTLTKADLTPEPFAWLSS